MMLQIEYLQRWIRCSGDELYKRADELLRKRLCKDSFIPGIFQFIQSPVDSCLLLFQLYTIKPLIIKPFKLLPG